MTKLAHTLCHKKHKTDKKRQPPNFPKILKLSNKTSQNLKLKNNPNKNNKQKIKNKIFSLISTLGTPTARNNTSDKAQASKQQARRKLYIPSYLWFTHNT